MALESRDMDTWENTVQGLPYALYMYYIDDSMFGSDRTSILGNCPAIQSVQYTPFIEPGDINGYNIPYDVARFGKPDSIRPQLSSPPQVIRISELQQKVRLIGQFNLYDIDGLTLGGKRNWKNESRLYNWPYSFALLTDYLNPPMTIKYHLCPRRNIQNVKVRQSISDRCSYGIFLEGYKKDNQGTMESIVSGDAHELPSTSSAYSQWFASSKNQTRFGMQQALDQSFLRQAQGTESNQMQMFSTAIGGLMSGIGSLASGNLFGVGQSIAGMTTGAMGTMMQQKHLGQSAKLDRQGIIGSNLAMKNDLRSTPNTLLSQGSDVMYGLLNGGKKVDVIRYMINDEFARRLGDYFAMYGYKMNRIMRINRRDRKYYNYIKTVGVNIKSQGVPKQYVEELREIYNSGVTIWHIDREGVQVGDYSMDNVEM